MGRTDAMTDLTAKDRLPISVCLGFGVGTVGVSIMLNGVTAYFPAFMSTVLGKDAQIAGYLLMASKLYDAFADLVIGNLSDRTRSRWGRRRPFLLWGALLSALSFLAIFSPPDLGENAVNIYMLGALILYSTGYSLFNVPYMAMPSEMTPSKYERSRLLSFRTVFVSIGQVLAMGGTAALISAGGGGAEGYRIMAYVMTLLIGGAMLLSFFGTAKAPQLEVIERPKEKQEQGSFRLLLANRPFCLLAAAKIFQFLSFASVATTSLLFMLNVLQIGYTGQVMLAVTQNVASALSMPGWLWLERRLGKRNAYLIGITIMSVTSLSWLLAQANPGTAELIVRGIALGAGSGGMILLSISMLSDTLAYDRELTGLQREGLLSSVIAVIEKTAFAFGVAVVGMLLSHAHYLPTKNGQIIQQPASAVSALYICFAVLPVILFACNAACILFYKLGGRYSPVITTVDPEPII
jgi:GPH family glycoside/pentoside/hexuronide:cation symporter